MAGISSVKSAIYHSCSASIVHSNPREKGQNTIKAGSLSLNGQNITVQKGDSLESISEKINKCSHYTGVKAKIVKQTNGYRLNLVSKSKPVEIQDDEGVLANLHKKGHIGKHSKHLIQVTGGELFYNKSSSTLRQSLRSLADHLQVFTSLPNILVALNEVPLAPVPVEDAPALIEAEIAVEEALAMVEEALAAAVEEAPAAVEEALAMVEEALAAAVEEAPAAVEEAPAAVEEAPAAVEEAPVPAALPIPDALMPHPVVHHPLMPHLHAHPPEGPPPTAAEIQAAINLAEQRAELEAAKFAANNLVDIALRNVVMSKGLINTIIEAGEYAPLFDSLQEALVKKFTLGQLENNVKTDDGLTIGARVYKNLNQHRNKGFMWTDLSKKFEIDAEKIEHITDRILNHWKVKI